MFLMNEELWWAGSNGRKKVFSQIAAQEGIAEHYIYTTIPLKGVILDPSLGLTT